MKEQLKELQGILKKGLPGRCNFLPRIIHVETRSKCNALCKFCPASVTTDKRKDLYLPDGLIEKIINELSALDYPNRLSFYNNNEPFLDERIFNIMESARKKIPKAYLELKSNGILLTIEEILKIFNAGLDMLYINYYSSAGKSEEKIRKIKEELGKMRRFKGHLEKGQYFARVIIYERDLNQTMGTRAGSSPNKQFSGAPLQKMCLRPFEMMAINPEGKVSVCSEDFYHTIEMGNISKEGLLEIWGSEKFNKFREKLLSGERSFTDACSRCDYKGFTYEMLMEMGLYKEPFKQKIMNVVRKVI